MAGTVPREQLPAFLAGLREAEVVAMVRVLQPVPAPQQPDRLLNTAQAAAKLGCSKSYLHRHHQQFPFVVHTGRRTLAFSSTGIDRFIKTRTQSNGG